MKNKIIITLFGIILLAMISFNVNAAGVSSPYWDDNPLYVYPGEVKEFSYTLQNMVGDKNLKMQATVEGDSSIISLIDSNTIYDVPLGRSDVAVKVKITVPSNAQIGQEWQVGLRFDTVESTVEGRPVSIGSAFSKGFKVIVGNPPSQEESISGQSSKPLLSENLTSLVILVVILIVLFVLISYFHKKRNDKIKNVR